MEKAQDGRIICDCGKLIAREKNGRLYVWCKNCKREIEIEVIREKIEYQITTKSL